MNIITFTVIAQALLTLYFAITHWINLYPWNDLRHTSFPHEKEVNCLMHVIQLTSIYGFAYQINSLMIMGLIFWSLWMFGHIFSWWIEYIFGATETQLRHYQKHFSETYKFLPSYPQHPAPDACHTVLGILSVIVTISVYFAYFCS